MRERRLRTPENYHHQVKENKFKVFVDKQIRTEKKREERWWVLKSEITFLLMKFFYLGFWEHSQSSLPIQNHV